MKKIFVVVAALLVCFAVTAQDKKVVKEKKSAISFNMGPAIPLGDFESTDETNVNAGFAKTGFNLNLNYDYMFVKNVGFTFNFLYGYHNLHKELLIDVNFSDLDHYQYIGFMFGPKFTGNISPKTDVNFRVLGGVGIANSPELVIAGETWMPGDWASSFGWKIDGDVRFNMKKNVFLMLNLGYTQMRPEYELDILPPGEIVEMHVSVLNINAGIGFKF
jgi:opacity protein-like surface antigen